MSRFRVREYRASWVIRGSVLAALAVWVAAAVMALLVSAPSHVFAAIFFFVLFFVVFVAYYFSMSFVVDEYGVTYRGATDFMHVDFEEIIKVDPSHVPLGGYYITTKTGGFMLSSFIKEYRELAELIAARAGLMPVH